MERERAIQRTADVDNALTSMANTLQVTIDDLNTAHERAIGASSFSNSLAKIVQVFNENYESLSMLDINCKKIESELDTIARGFQKVGM